MPRTCKCIKLRGKAFYRLADTAKPYSPDPDVARPWVFFGNLTNLTVDVSTREDRVPDYTTCCGGDACFRQEIDTINVTLESTCFEPELALRGRNAVTTAGSKSKTLATLNRGDVVILSPYIDPASVTFAPTALVRGTDWDVKGAGIEIYDTAPNVPAAGLTNVTVTWTQMQDANETQLFVDCVSKEYEIMFLADNCLDPDQGGIGQTMARVAISGSPQFELLGENAARFRLEGRWLPHPRMTGGASPFGTLQW